MLDEKDLQAIAGLITKSESMLLDEMERYDKKNEKRFDSISKDIEDLKTIYRMTKSENDTLNTLLRIIENMEKRLSDIENKIA